MREITIIYGKTGTGKSTKAKTIIDEYDRVIIVDPKFEYDGDIFTSFEEIADYMKDNPEIFLCVCRFQSDIEHEYLFKLCQVVGDLLLVVEEAEIYISPYTKQSNFLDLCKYGRHHNVSILGIARRSGELGIGFRSLVTRLISFKQTEPSDLKVLESLGFKDVDKLGLYEYIEILP